MPSIEHPNYEAAKEDGYEQVCELHSGMKGTSWNNIRNFFSKNVEGFMEEIGHPLDSVNIESEIEADKVLVTHGENHGTAVLYMSAYEKPLPVAETPLVAIDRETGKHRVTLSRGYNCPATSDAIEIHETNLKHAIYSSL